MISISVWFEFCFDFRWFSRNEHASSEALHGVQGTTGCPELAVTWLWHSVWCPLCINPPIRAYVYSNCRRESRWDNRISTRSAQFTVDNSVPRKRIYDVTYGSPYEGKSLIFLQQSSQNLGALAIYIAGALVMWKHPKWSCDLTRISRKFLESWNSWEMFLTKQDVFMHMSIVLRRFEHEGTNST